jgi:hypothetical protein
MTSPVLLRCMSPEVDPTRTLLTHLLCRIDVDETEQNRDVHRRSNQATLEGMAGCSLR